MKKHKRKELKPGAMLAIGALASLISVAVVAFILAIISSLTKDPTSLTGAFSLLSLVLAGIGSGFAISRIMGDGTSLIGTLSVVIASLVILIIGLIWNGGLLPLGTVLNILVFLAVGIIASILGKQRPHKKRRY